MKIVAYFPLVGRHSKLTRQRAILDDYIKMKRATVLDEFVESEVGLEQLREAIAAAEKQKAFLLFVTLGRYAKNLKALDLLAQSDVEFLTPETRRFTRKALDSFLKKAQEDMHERSDRIKKAMELAAKRNGEKYGSARPGHWTRKNNHLRGWKKANEVAVQKRAQRCADAYATILPEIAMMVEKGETYTEIAKALNEAGHVTTTGSPFSAPTVFKIFKRLGGRLNGTQGRKVGRKAALAAAN